MRRRLSALALLPVAWCVLSGHSCCGGAFLKVLCRVSLSAAWSGGGGAPSLESAPSPEQEGARFRGIGAILEKVDRHGYHTLTEEERLLLIRYRMRR